MEIIHRHFLSIDSTNNYAKSNAHLMDPEKITLITAHEQTAGRGRETRRWVSPAGYNIYATFCFFMPKQKKDIGNAGQLLALSAVSVLEALGFKPQLKWPNDLLLSKKKFGGILCETVSVDDQLCVVNGIGLNVNMPRELLQQIDIPATSLHAEKGMVWEVQEVLEFLKEAFSRDLSSFLEEGFAPFSKKLKELMEYSLGTKIRFHDRQQIWEGSVHAINDNGSITLRLPSEEMKTFISGEILF